MYCVINTTEYNDDGCWCVQTSTLDDLGGIGFDEDDRKRIEQLNVGSMLNDFDYAGVIVIRIA